MFLNPTSEIEIKKIIASLKVSSPGWDEIGIRMIICFDEVYKV